MKSYTLKGSGESGYSFFSFIFSFSLFTILEFEQDGKMYRFGNTILKGSGPNRLFSKNSMAFSFPILQVMLLENQFWSSRRDTLTELTSLHHKESLLPLLGTYPYRILASISPYLYTRNSDQVVSYSLRIIQFHILSKARLNISQCLTSKPPSFLALHNQN